MDALRCKRGPCKLDGWPGLHPPLGRLAEDSGFPWRGDWSAKSARPGQGDERAQKAARSHPAPSVVRILQSHAPSNPSVHPTRHRGGDSLSLTPGWAICFETGSASKDAAACTS